MKYIKPHLSPELRAQITPQKRRDVKLTAAGVFFLVASILLIVNLWPKKDISPVVNNKSTAPIAQSTADPAITDQKQVLGAATHQDPEPQFTQYAVKNGDTLFNISQQYNVRWDSIAQINNLAEPYVLHAGQTLKIPQDTTSKVPNKIYTIKNGDTLASIAKQFNITVDDIIAVNPNLQNSDLITVGQVIKLP
ncbi:MAG: LysM peptidoglycan-binding domain-containing protein [Candidatus Doudnabacteria bacterium]